ncbi:NADH-quinone oxidoreductase subunit N [Geothrix fermentans]|jgi:NADH-quinone oxidoreductase subunit N|uniref:NADH-quinone oxidoreductase subunit N n=1 Tax=Geothrix fermentans TaxID=44676 RepID=UPI0003F8958E|nr:NADH-quinone oxidoreductase subunit N [Geothrix fermentans]
MSGFAQGLLDALLRDTHLITPQLFLMVVATLMLWPGDLFFNRTEKHRWAPITLVVLAITAMLIGRTPDGEGFSRMFRMDGLTRGFQMLCVLGAAVTVSLSVKLLNSLKQQTVEYYALILFSLAGMLFLCGASDLISVYFSLELMAICIYILVAYLRDRATSVEAGVKYFLLGAFSSGILVYGISLLYGASGGATTNLADLNQALALTPTTSNLLVFSGVLMVLMGMAFKVAAVPFHMWSPDAYEGAPTPITLFMATAPKAAALAAFLRVFGAGLHGVSGDWVMPLSYIAGASMILGNVTAVRQESMKRLLAYSSIAHVGYMLLGVLSGDPKAGAQVVWLYMLIYLVMNTGAFAVVIYLQGKGEGERIEDFRGLGRKHPVLAFAMMIFLLSLAGIPPLAGFFGKFFLFKLAIEQGFVTLTTIALLTSVVGAYYYLGVVAQMYFREPEGEAAPMGASSVFIVSLACALVLVATAFGPWLVDWAAKITWV